MSTELFIEIIPRIIALSGWTTLAYNWYTNKPKIKGQIMNVLTGNLKNPNNPSQEITAFNAYVYLTNARKNTVHILDYELEVDTGNGYERVKRVYGTHEIPNWGFESEEKIIQIPDFPKKLITVNAKPVEYGVPLHGFILFASERPMNQFKENVKSFRVTCVDAFGNKHKIVADTNQFPSFYLLQDLAGMKIYPKEGFDKMSSRRTLVKDAIFKDTDIPLDGHSWFNCRFIACRIIIERGEFDLVNCSFDKCNLVATGNAVSILKISKLFYPQIPLFDDTDTRKSI